MNSGTNRIKTLQTALARAGSAAGFHELAALKLAASDVDGAIAAYAECLTFEPHNAAIHNNYGAALIRAGRFNDAIGVLQAALALRPGYQRALVNLGKALREAGRPAEAIATLRQALAIQHDYVPALVNLGDACAAVGDLDSALLALERAVQIAPAQVESWMTLGIVHLQSGRIGKALDVLRTAIVIAPDHPDAHSNLAHALFCAGEWQAAWPHFEYRFRRHAHRAKLRMPPRLSHWDGALSADLELWLVAEQGLGDQLQFARYARLLCDSGVRCVLACDPRLVHILSLAQLGARIVASETSVEAGTAQWIPLMSLPAWHGTRSDTVPHPAGYLAADPDRVTRWHERLRDSSGLRVALSWAGNPDMETGRYSGRSPPLAAFAPVLALPKVDFVSVQKGHGEEQLDALPFSASIRRLPDLDAGPHAFLDTAAVLKCVDLLVTSDTAIAHLAGALGVPCWLCLMHEPDWRWMREGRDTPWYTSMSLFRQPAAGDWASVFHEVAAALAPLAARAPK
jgi:tetratricopeptide (TPR) repeat protein